MAKPTEQQVRALELVHKQQFVYLVLANRLWLKLYAELVASKSASPTNPKYVSWLMLGKTISKLAGKWYARQHKLEVGGATKFDLQTSKLFLIPAKQKELEAVAANLLPSEEAKKTGLKGIGIIPLIIWAVIAIVGFFTAKEIVDETTTTAQEKAELMKQTETTLKDLNISGDKAAAIINETQQQASAGGGFFSGLTTPLLVGLAILLFMNSNKKSNG